MENGTGLVWFPLGMETNEAGQATPQNTTKHPLASRTIWVQIIALISAFIPAVQEWLASNPVEIVSVFVAINILVRFVTSGKVSILGRGAAVLLFGFLSVASLSLSSCAGLTVSGSAYYRDETTGAKAGLNYVPGAPPLPFFRVPVETGSGRGLVEIRAEK